MKNFNPTSRLPRLKSQPSIRKLTEALELLSKIYAPSLRFQFSSRSDSSDEPSSNNQRLPSDDLDLSEEDLIQIVRADETERRFAKNWLTQMIGSGLDWIQEEAEKDEEDLKDESSRPSAISSDQKMWDVSSLIDLAGNILASEAKVEESKEGLDRTFTFPLSPSPFSEELYESFSIKSVSESSQEASVPRRSMENAHNNVTLTLLDLPLPPSGVSSSEDQASASASTDHDDESASAASAVGLQTWAASIVLSDLLIRNSLWLHSDLEKQRSERRALNIVELGAGTGLVGLVAAKHLQTIENGTENNQEPKDLISLTDYHPTVLDHLRSNVTNVMKNEGSSSLEVKVEKLDWEEVDSGLKSIESTTWTEGKGDSDLVLAADVVYSQTHASWLHSTILCTLKIDLQLNSEGDQVKSSKSRAHVLCAKRERGRFGEWALIEGVDKVFGKVFKLEEADLDRRNEDEKFPQLRVIERRELPKVKGLGRQDENGWVWWQLAWVNV